jgi:hypothetical protein
VLGLLLLLLLLLVVLLLPAPVGSTLWPSPVVRDTRELAWVLVGLRVPVVDATPTGVLSLRVAGLPALAVVPIAVMPPVVLSVVGAAARLLVLLPVSSPVPPLCSLVARAGFSCCTSRACPGCVELVVPVSMAMLCLLELFHVAVHRRLVVDCASHCPGGAGQGHALSAGRASAVLLIVLLHLVRHVAVVVPRVLGTAGPTSGLLGSLRASILAVLGRDRARTDVRRTGDSAASLDEG